MRNAASILVLVCISVVSAVVLAFVWGGLSHAVTLASFTAGLAAAAIAWRSVGPSSGGRRLTEWDVALIVVFAVASLRAFLWLIYVVDDEWRVLSPNNLGDIALHLQFIRYLASGVDFWPASPILSGSPLVYPLGMDLFNSLLALAGVPVERGLVWTGLGGAVLTAWALWRWGGGFALAAFLFAGGLAGFAVFQTGTVDDFQSRLAWKNLFLAMFVTQRGLLYALPCGLLLLTAWREDFFGAGSGLARWIQFLLYTTLPLFSVHAFVFLSLLLAAIFLCRPSARIPLLIFVGCAVPPASLAVYLVTGRFAAGSGLRWLPGWMQGGDGWTFWALNFGISLPLLGVLAWLIAAGRRIEALAFAGTGIVVFLLCFLFAFAPWEWDNTKLLIWAWLACAPYLWAVVIQPLTAWPRAAVCFALFFSGAISLVGGLDGRHGYKLALRSELAAGARDLNGVPPGDRLAIEPEYNHPAILLGRPVLCGYEGHLWSHGLEYRNQWNDLHAILRRDPGWKELARRNGVKWVYEKDSIPIRIPDQ